MEMRRQQRAFYQSRILLRPMDREESFVARVQNLSPAGAFVTTAAAHLPPVGAAVACQFTIAREGHTLRGRVAWVREASKDTPLTSCGAGIEFTDLGEQDADLLRGLVEPIIHQSLPIQVWFEGMATPTRCQGMVIGDSIRVTTTLPFMRLQSTVRVAFPELAGGSPREGRLAAVMLEPSGPDGVPRLNLTLSVRALDNARGSIEVRSAKVTPVTLELPKVREASTLVDPTLVAAALVFDDPGAPLTPPAEPPPATPPAAVALSVSAPPVSLVTAPAGTPGRSPAHVAVGLMRGAGPILLGGLVGAFLVGLVWMLRGWLFPP